MLMMAVCRCTAALLSPLCSPGGSTISAEVSAVPALIF